MSGHLPTGTPSVLCCAVLVSSLGKLLVDIVRTSEKRCRTGFDMQGFF